MTKYNKNIELKRVNINLPVQLVDKIEKYALNMGINITSAYIVLLNNALDYKESLEKVPILMNVLNGVQNTMENLKNNNIEKCNDNINDINKLINEYDNKKY